MGQLAGEEQSGEVVAPRLKEALVALGVLFGLGGLLLDEGNEAGREELLDAVHKLGEGEDE